MASPRRADDVKLSTVQAAVVLGLSRKTTNRMCQGSYPLPDGWWSEQESRPQGTRWVLFCPADDPRLARLDQDVPRGDGGPGDVLVAPTTMTADHRVVPGHGSVDLVLARLVEIDRERDGDRRAHAVQRERIGYLQAKTETLEKQVADQVARLAQADGERVDLLQRTAGLDAEAEQLRQRLADRDREMVRLLADRDNAQLQARQLALEIDQLRLALERPFWRRALLWLKGDEGT